MGREDSPPPLGPRDWLVMAFICCASVCAQKVANMYMDPDANLWRTTPPTAPLVVERTRFYDDTTFASLAACAVDNPLLARNPLGGTFNKTTGLLVRFTAAGYAAVVDDGNLTCFAPFVDTARRRYPEANAFVLNVVSAAPGGERDPVHWHVDQTFSLPYSPGWHVAHFVDVLYVSVPADMEGGRLEVQKVPDPWLDEHGLRARALYELEHGEPPSLNASVAPENNKLVTFRGDAHHRVRPFAAAADDRRVSIVLESYVLPRFDIWRARRLVPTFQVGEGEEPAATPRTMTCDNSKPRPSFSSGRVTSGPSN